MMRGGAKRDEEKWAPVFLMNHATTDNLEQGMFPSNISLL